jgi:hypothetical protein
VNILDALEAVELEVQIRSMFPQLSPTHLKMPDGKYGVVITRWEVEYSQYYGIEYSAFKRYAEKSGFVLDIPDTGLLLNPIEKSLLITTPGQWTLLLMMENYTDIPSVPRSKAGRPRTAHAA